MRVEPANRAPFEDLQQIFGARGSAARCQCQRYKLAPRESFGSMPVEERVHRIRVQTACGDPEAGGTTGLVAYDDDGIPVGWCAAEPRSDYRGLVRNQKVPWAGRDEDRADPSVCAITCLMVRAGHRRRGVSDALVLAAVDFARESGARAVEAYPMTTAKALSDELHPGLLSSYLRAGFAEVTRPTVRRAVVRLEL